ncbi:MAG: 30S ribosomal protein S21 [Saprospiraceae bacterium]|nr:30S ribosomal protein S21 [Saprospiraceae bacterium]
MLIIDVKDNEGIDKALKRYKRKYQQSQIIQQLRQRQHFTKPSVKRRNEILKAVYKQQKQEEEGGDSIG